MPVGPLSHFPSAGELQAVQPSTMVQVEAAGGAGLVVPGLVVAGGLLIGGSGIQGRRKISETKKNYLHKK